MPSYEGYNGKVIFKDVICKIVCRKTKPCASCPMTDDIFYKMPMRHIFEIRKK